MAAKSKKSAKAKTSAKAGPPKKGQHGVLRGPKGRAGGGDSISLSTITVNVDTSEYGCVVVTAVGNDCNMGIFSLGNLRGPNTVPSGVVNMVGAIAMALPAAGSTRPVQAIQASKLAGPPYYSSLSVSIPTGGSISIGGGQQSP